MQPFAPTEFEAQWIQKARALKPLIEEGARQLDERGGWPEENFKLLTEQGFLKLGVPKEYGGFSGEEGGFSFACHAVLEVVASACGSTAWALMSQYHCLGLIAGLANEEQKTRIFRDVVTNGARLSSCGSEVRPPQKVTVAGQDGKLSFASDLTPTDGGFIANGTKGFTTMGAAAKYLLFWALAPGTADTDHGVCLGVIEQPHAGIEFLTGWEESTGIRASLSGLGKFSNIFIPWNNMVGEPGDFNQSHPYSFDLALACISAGLCQGMYEFALQTVKERDFLQKDDFVMYQLGEMATSIEATRSLWWRAQRLYDEKDFGQAGQMCLKALHQSKETVALVSRNAVEVVGTRALFKWNPIERLARDARMVTLHTRETQVMRTVADQELTQDLFPKAKYGRKLPAEERKTWEELGFKR